MPHSAVMFDKRLYIAVLEAPEKLENWQNFAAMFRTLDVEQFDPQLKKAFIDCLREPIRNPQDLSRAALSLVKLTPGFEPFFGPHLLDPLLLLLLEKTLVADPLMEKVLTRARCHLLTEGWHPEHLPFLEALVKQCARNEYVYSSFPEEEVLARRAPPLLQRAYFPEESLPMGMVETRTAIQNGISQRVAAQYEENPYPRWELLPLPDRTIYPIETLGARDILIAGCGTGQQAFQAGEIFPEAAIDAFDLSYTSLGYALSKKREENISFFQADILELEGWEKRFDLIECSGVLHHMEDPLHGWRILRNLLKPGGWMLIGLYSTLGRQDIRAAREMIAGQDLRTARQTLLKLPQSHPAKNVTQTIDFYTFSGCRDLLFHAHELTFTLSEIEEMLKGLGLQFERFIWRDPELTRKNLSLREWGEYEKAHPETFAGMYQFWVKDNIY